MPISFRVDRENHVVLARAWGVVTATQLTSYIETVLRDANVQRGFNELIDLRGVTRVEVSDRGIG